MKHLIIALVLFLTIHADAGWFGSSKEEQQRLAQTEQQLALQRQTTSNWQLIAGVLGIGGVILFTFGTALGSRIRRHE